MAQKKPRIKPTLAWLKDQKPLRFTDAVDQTNTAVRRELPSSKRVPEGDHLALSLEQLRPCFILASASSYLSYDASTPSTVSSKS